MVYLGFPNSAIKWALDICRANVKDEFLNTKYTEGVFSEIPRKRESRSSAAPP
jgi:hypothetical protein